MKLKNKKTGMIGEAGYISTSDGDIIVNNINDQDEWYDYKTLAELNEEWEDYEEPKEFWFVDSGGEVEEATYLTDNDKSSLRNFGNYFETKEEAEKAVEKLKALKRLKDKGFKFTGWSLLEYAGYDSFSYSPQIGFSIPTLDKDEPYEYPEEIERDVDLLFVGEEK